MSIQSVSSYSYYPAYMPYVPVQVPVPQPMSPTPVLPPAMPCQDCFTPAPPFDVNEYVKQEMSQFAYTPEEQAILKSDPFHDFLKDFVTKKDYARALDYINRFDDSKNYAELKKYITNPAFDSLANSKFYNDSIFGFENLAETIYALHETQQNAYKKVSEPGYFCPYIPDVTNMYAGIDVNQCVTNLDKFFKSGISEDLKEYIKSGTDKLKDLWFVTNNLSDIDKNASVQILLAPYSIM